MKYVPIGIALFTLPLLGLYQAIVGSFVVSIPITVNQGPHRACPARGSSLGQPCAIHPRCTHIFRAAPCQMYRDAICHAQIQRTQKAEKNCATTTAASNAPAVIAAATSATRSITPSKAIANAAT
jgi:hypothetical protein